MEEDCRDLRVDDGVENRPSLPFNQDLNCGKPSRLQLILLFFHIMALKETPAIIKLRKSPIRLFSGGAGSKEFTPLVVKREVGRIPSFR